MTTLRRLLSNVKDKDGPKDRQGAVNKIKCCDCQVHTLVRPAEIVARDWLNTNERQEMMSTITLLNTILIRRRNIKSAGTLRHVFRILQTTTDQRLTLENWYNASESYSQKLPAPYKWLIILTDSSKSYYERMTEQPKIWLNNKELFNCDHRLVGCILPTISLFQDLGQCGRAKKASERRKSEWVKNSPLAAFCSFRHHPGT